MTDQVTNKYQKTACWPCVGPSAHDCCMKSLRSGRSECRSALPIPSPSYRSWRCSAVSSGLAVPRSRPDSGTSYLGTPSALYQSLAARRAAVTVDACALSAGWSRPYLAPHLIESFAEHAKVRYCVGSSFQIYRSSRRETRLLLLSLSDGILTSTWQSRNTFAS